jgi:hypothetical protein
METRIEALQKRPSRGRGRVQKRTRERERTMERDLGMETGDAKLI